MRAALLASLLNLVAAGEAAVFPERFDPTAPIDAQALLVAPTVTDVAKDGLARTLGIRAGDRLVAIDGRRVYGDGEFDLVRLGVDGERDGVELDLVRDGAVVHVASARTLPVRRLGFVSRIDEAAMLAPLRPWGVAADGEAGASCVAWRAFPRRPLASILRWLAAHDPARDDHAWLGDLERLFRALRDQDWAGAAALPEPRPPGADLVELVRFWRSLAAANAGEEQEPDPSRHGVSLEYFVAHYPYPRLVPPPLGGAAASGADWVAAVGAARDREAAGLPPIPIDQSGVDIEWSPVERWWSTSLIAAIVDPDRAGGWPFRHGGLHDDAQRAQILQRMRAEAASGRADAPFYRLAAIPPALQEAIERHDDEPSFSAAIDAAFAELVAVRDWSPFLAAKGASWVARTVEWRDLNDQMPHVRDGMARLALPLTAKPSRLLAHLDARSADTCFSLFDPPLRVDASPFRVWLALRQRPTTAELRAQLAAAAHAPDLAARRRELLLQGRDAFKMSCSRAESQLIIGLVGDGHGYGLMTDVGGDLLTWGRIRPYEGGVAWFMAVAFTADDGDDRGRLPMRAAIAALPADPGGPLRTAVAAAADDAGSPASLLMLARACDRRGDGDDAVALRARAKRFLDALVGFLPAARFPPSTRRILALASAEWRCGDDPSARDCLADLDLAKRWAKDGDLGNEAHLLAARARLSLGDEAAAVDELCESFTDDADPKRVFLVADDDASLSSPPFRTWLLERLAPKLDADQRKRLAAAAKAPLIDARFSAVLGLAAGSGGQANDF